MQALGLREMFDPQAPHGRRPVFPNGLVRHMLAALAAGASASPRLAPPGWELPAVHDHLVETSPMEPPTTRGVY